MQVEFDRIIPYVRMTRRGKFVQPRAKRYLGWKDTIAWDAKLVMQHMEADMTEGEPLAAELVIEQPISKRYPLHYCDLDNQVKAVLDAVQGIIFDDDKHIHAISAIRRGVDEGAPFRAVLDILPMDGLRYVKFTPEEVMLSIAALATDDQSLKEQATRLLAGRLDMEV